MTNRPAALVACIIALILAFMPVARAMAPAPSMTGASGSARDSFGFVVCQPGGAVDEGTDNALPSHGCDHCLTQAGVALPPTDQVLLSRIDASVTRIAWGHGAEHGKPARWPAAQARAPPLG